jgi:hypothetical protein
MINPVNSDKSIQTTTDKPDQSRSNSKVDPMRAHSEPVQQAQATVSGRSTLDVDSARQLYEMESARSESASTISTAQQARSLLDTLVEQISNSPESAAKAQLTQVSQPMANLLASSPA